MKFVTLELNGKQERFTEKFDGDYYDCFLQCFRLQEGRALIKFTYYWQKDYCESEEYSTIFNEFDKKIKLLGEFNKRLPKSICKALNKRFSKMLSAKFV